MLSPYRAEAIGNEVAGFVMDTGFMDDDGMVEAKGTVDAKGMVDEGTEGPTDVIGIVAEAPPYITLLSFIALLSYKALSP